MPPRLSELASFPPTHPKDNKESGVSTNKAPGYRKSGGMWDLSRGTVCCCLGWCQEELEAECEIPDTTGVHPAVTYAQPWHTHQGNGSQRTRNPIQKRPFRDHLSQCNLGASAAVLA
ncbi:hypothetical protein DPEC_G00136870 [Dallia pectoralis]|uniref:Uncharacterized protein n=1 Tax=Dallia pectoralis TaxID=75939 RepID=A0ACC2GM11_DALPE|nr:hypothetical protein DPEC_G00136870 [Dallia pectoralis]